MEGRTPWRTLSSRLAYENPWIRVREDRVLRPDGHEGIYGVIELRPSVAVVALNAEREVALVGQWRYPTGKYSWELPRGGSAPGETDLRAVAARELAEEAGVQAADWELLGSVDLNNGVTNNVEHLFLATRLTACARHPDPEEQIVMKWVPLTEAVGMALGGGIAEVCSVAALLIVERRLRGAGDGPVPYQPIT